MHRCTGFSRHCVIQVAITAYAIMEMAYIVTEFEAVARSWPEYRHQWN